MDVYEQARAGMVNTLRVRYGVTDTRILAAMQHVPRHRFVPGGDDKPQDAYGDHPLPIGHGQTISQPFIVAYMTASLKLSPGAKVLEIGTGCGYQAAVLAELGCRVFSVETVSPLAREAAALLEDLGYGHIMIRLADGYLGWPENAPYDGILCTCAPPAIPDGLPPQLADGGRMILPVGVTSQSLVVVQRNGDRWDRDDDIGVRFVPMVHGRPSA